MRFDLWHDCAKYPITDLLSFIVDNRGKTVPTAEAGHKLIATNCVTNNTLFPVYEKVRYLSEDTYQNWFRAHPIPGDILFVCKGTPGRVCMVPDPIDFCIAQDMIALRANERVYWHETFRRRTGSMKEALGLSADKTLCEQPLAMVNLAQGFFLFGASHTGG